MSEQALFEPLTEREAEVLAYLSEGLSNSEIADRLFLAPSTVKWYVTQLNRKLDTANRDEIIERANQLRLLQPAAASTPAKHNLPNPPTPFIGRESELDELTNLLTDPDVRLLTILALGGMGKTRIALEAARQQVGNFKDGVFFVPLADVEHIVRAIAEHTSFQFRQDHEHEAERQILDFLRNKQMLLLLDNFEHLLEHAPLVTAILEAAPDVKVLVTSREKLNLTTETMYTLHGLPYPPWETPAHALEYDSVKLLLQAAKRVKPDWTVTPDNLDVVARVCRLTDGMPLGILLAASWLDVFSLDYIADQIQANVDFLETEMRDVSQRQRSIRAVFESSWKCLNSDEQTAFMQLSVFRGGCTPAAAVAVTGANPRAFQALVNKALLIHNQQGRYELHELLRQYGEDRLEKSGLAAATYAAHSAYYCDFLQARVDDLQGKRQIGALEELDQEYKNIHAAWLWAAKHEHLEHLDQALFSIQFYHSVRGPYTESLNLLQRAIDSLRTLPATTLRDQTLARVLAISSSFHTLLWQYEAARRVLEEGRSLLVADGTPHDRAMVAYFQAVAYPRDYETARQYLTEALSTFRTCGDEWWIARVLSVWGDSLIWNYDPQQGLKLLEEAREIQERLGDRFGLANTLLWLSRAAEHLHDYVEASKLTFCALDHYRELGAPSGVYQAFSNLGLFAEEVGDFELARQHYEASLALAQESGNQADMFYQSWSLAYVALAQGRYDEADALCEPAARYFEAIGGAFTSIVLIRAGEIALAQGNLAAAHGYFEQGNQLAQAHESILYMAFGQRGLGKVAHQKGLFAVARDHLDKAREALDRYETMKPLSGPYKKTELSTVLIALADVEFSEDNITAAAQHLQEALAIAQSAPRVPVTLSVIASAAILLTAREQYERAAELMAYVQQHPHAFGVDRDRLMYLQAQLETELSEEAYQAACERGAAMDLEAAAAYLLAG